MGVKDSASRAAAAAVWKAAASARMWAAAIRNKAARTEYRKAWEDKAGAAAAEMRAAEANKNAVGASGRIDAAAIGRAAAELGEVAEAAARASAAFDRTSKLGKMDANERERAAEAYAQAADIGRERALRIGALATLRLALTAAEWSAIAAADAHEFRQQADRWAAGAAKWGSGPGRGGRRRDEWIAEWTGALEDAKKEQAEWSDLAAYAVEEERRAARGLDLVAAAAAKAAATAAVAVATAAAAAPAAAGRGRHDAGMEAAAAALGRAMAAARKAAEDGADGQAAAGGGADGQAE